ncbi:MAG: Flp family type IVb pilin [Firmicutes bacterium]|nr:Flp family type IVb pilin [Bacillota bacterium]
MLKTPVTFFLSEEGQALTEYGLVLAFVVMAVILVLRYLGTAVSALLQQLPDAFAGVK